MAVGARIQEWAYANRSDEMDATLRELVGDPSGVVFGDTDLQLLASWQLNDRELSGCGTPAQRYAELLRVRTTDPGRAIEIEDVTRGSVRARVASHEVASHVQTNDIFVGHLMPGPPAVSL